MGPSETQLIQAFDQAPQAIQESLSDGNAVEFMISLTTRYGLHIDTAGYVSEFIRNMLLGFLQPEQFLRKLKSVGLTEQLARNLTADLNKEVFLPLRDQVRGTGAARSVAAVAVMHVAPEPAKLKEVSTSKPADEAPSYNLIRQTPVGKAQSAVLLPPAPVAVATVASPTTTVSAPVPTMRTMQHDIDLIQHGSQPAPYPALGVLHPTQATPARMFQTASVPMTAPPVPMQPREMLHVIPDAPKTSPLPVPQIAPVKEFAGDPYRESI